jgi:heparanase
LWRRLMGTRILDAGPQRAGLHLYAHCLRGVPGGVSLLAINLEGKEKRLRLSGPAELYSLTAREPLSRTVLLNGRELAVTPEDTLPPMEPVRFKGRGIVLPPLGNAFIALPKAHNPACRSSERSL